jgi:FkbM family methyltransferase
MSAYPTNFGLSGFAARAYESLVPRRIRIGLHNRWFVRHEARWRRIKGTPEAVTHRVDGDLRLRLYGDSLLCEMIYFGGFEAETSAFFRAFLKPGDVFLDAGANIGLFTVAAAHAVGRGGHVHAFEPCSQTYARLLENVRLNGGGNVSCHRLALSSSEGEAELTTTTDGHDAWNSLGSPCQGEAGKREAVRTVTLDAFAREKGLMGRITAVKIDVEGWESHVLAGGNGLLSREDAPLLCVEFTEEAAQLAGSSCAALYEALERLGYQLFTVSPDPAEIEPFAARAPFPNVNLLACKDLAAVRRRLAP